MGVYKISFDDAYYYIGSSVDLRSRFIGWRTRMKAGTNKNKKIREIIKHTDVIEFTILELVEHIDDLRAKESFYINTYWDDPLLLNYCPNGDSNKGIRWNEEDLKNRKRATFFAKPVAIFNKDGILVKRFDFIIDAAKYLNIDRRDITKYLKGRRSTLKGFSIKLIGKNEEYIEPAPFLSKKKPPKSPRVKQPNTPSKEIIKYSLSGIELNRYTSINQAAKSMNTDKRNFKKLIKKSPKSYYKGFIWKYA